MVGFIYHSKILCAIIFLLTAQVSAQSQNQVKGDQTVGGVHLFEFHTPEGGMGFGFKMMILLVVIVALIYWYVKRKAKSYVTNHLPMVANAANTGFAACGHQSNNLPVGQPMVVYQPSAPMAPQPYSPSHAPRPKRYRQKSYSEDEDPSRGHLP